MAEKVVAHSVTGPPGTFLAEWLDRDPHLHGTFHPIVGPFPFLIVRLSGPTDAIERASRGLPAGAALAEAVAVRLRRAGASVERGEPEVLGLRALRRLCMERGRSSVDLARGDPSLVPELQVGSWFAAAWRARAVRRLLRAPLRSGLAGAVLRRRAVGLRTALDAAFWSGVRAAARPHEWRRLTASSYVALSYHRIAGEGKPGQERLDLPPERFDSQMRLLRLLRFHSLGPDELLAFHSTADSTLDRRSYVVTADDGYRDCAVALQRHASHRPQLFVPTHELGGEAWWAGGEPLVDWHELERLSRAGVHVGAHTRTHASLPELDDGALEGEVAGALADLRGRLPRALPALAYPHGRHDRRVRAAAVDAGYRVAYTTEPGRNGAGTDPWCLRRVGIKAHDGRLSFLWKVLTGQPPPGPWERRRLRRAAGR